MAGFARALAVGLLGVQGRVVEVEAHLAQGLPGLVITGLPDAAVVQARDRVRAAVLNSGQRWPDQRMTVGLGPAWLPKHGTAFDLAMVYLRQAYVTAGQGQFRAQSAPLEAMDSNRSTSASPASSGQYQGGTGTESQPARAIGPGWPLTPILGPPRVSGLARAFGSRPRPLSDLGGVSPAAGSGASATPPAPRSESARRPDRRTNIRGR